MGSKILKKFIELLLFLLLLFVTMEKPIYPNRVIFINSYFVFLSIGHTLPSDSHLLTDT